MAEEELDSVALDELPLEGVTVLDLTHLLAGPHCSMNLADLGARVIKIEPPAGEIARKRLPARVDDEGDRLTAYFAATNRGKEDVVVDLKTPLGMQVLDRLLEKADVLVVNFRASALKRLRLDPEELRVRYPRLIVATVTGFGLEPASKKTERPALAVVAEAESGVLHRLSKLTKYSPLGAIEHGFNIGDLVAGVTAAGAVCAALYRRERTGKGCWLDLSMAEALMALNGVRTAAVDFKDVSTVKPGGLPFGIFDAADGAVVIGVKTERFWVLLCEAMGTPDLAGDQRFATEQARHNNKPEVMEIVRVWALQHPVQHIIDLLIDHGVPCSPVNSPEDVRESDIFRNRGALWEVDSGHGGTVTLPGNPMGFFKGREHALRIPRLGEHTRAVLTELGFSEDEVADVINGRPAAVRS